jgi:hypothetical protein
MKQWRKRNDTTGCGRGYLVPLALLVAFALATQGSGGCGSSSSSSSSSSPSSSGGSSGSSGEGSSHNNPSANASDSNTPSVGPSGSVEVDKLRWRLVHAERASSIGDPEVLGAKANGEFVVATLHVTNNKSDTASLTDDVVSLRAGGKDYKVSSNAQTALSGGGAKPLLFEEVGPEVSTTVRVGFDVPPQVLHEHPQLRFKELGFGPTHAYIALP